MKKYISLVLIAIVIGGISIFGHTFIKNKEYEFELRDYNTMKQVHDIIENSMQLNVEDIDLWLGDGIHEGRIPIGGNGNIDYTYFIESFPEKYKEIDEELNSVLKISSLKVSHADLYYLVIYDNGDVVINFTDIQYNVVQGNYTNCVYQFG